jgi:hypothetical protein
LSESQPEPVSFSNNDASHKNTSMVDVKKKQKKVVGFRHSSLNLKRIAQMPVKYRKEILTILKKQAKDQKARILARSTKIRSNDGTCPSKVSSSTSISSANKDWEH